MIIPVKHVIQIYSDDSILSQCNRIFINRHHRNLVAQVTPPGGPGGGTGGGGTGSLWGGVVVNIGDSSWHCEAFPVGKNVVNCWGVNAQNQDYSFTVTYDWATGLWSPLSAGNTAPPRGQLGLATNATTHEHDVSATSAGTIKYKLQWVGTSGLAPAFIDLLLSGAASYGSTTAIGTADDGIGSQTPWSQSDSNGYIGGVTSKKLRRFPVGSSGVVQFSVSTSASDSASGLGSNCGATSNWYNALKVNRGVALACTTHPGGSVKQFTGIMQSYQHNDWPVAQSNGTTTTGITNITWELAQAVPNTMSYTEKGEFWRAPVALQTYATRDDQIVDSQLQELVTFQGSISYIDYGTYNYTGPIGGGGEQLPSGILANGWNVLPYDYYVFRAVDLYKYGQLPVYTSPIYGNSNCRILHGNVGTSDTVKFNYTSVSDGASADAQVQLDYKLPLERLAPAGSWDEQPEPDVLVQGQYGTNSVWDPYVRYAGFEVLKPSHDQEYTPDYNDTDTAEWEAKGVTMIAASKEAPEKVKATAGLIGWFTDGEMKWKAAFDAVGVFVDMYSAFYPLPVPVNVARSASKFDNTFRMNMIDPMPATDNAQLYMGGYNWRVQRRCLYKTQVYADDLYSAGGYGRPSLGFEYDLLSNYDERQQFKQPGQGGGLG